jgi:hypothetical protein
VKCDRATLSGITLNPLRLGLAAALLFACACAKPAPVLGTFTATPADVAVGSPCVLTWTVKGADTLQISPGVGPVTGTSVTVFPQSATTYRLTATNAGGTAFREVAVAVHDPTPAAQIYSFDVDHHQAAPGGTVTLSWVQAGATALTLSGADNLPALQPTDTQALVQVATSTTFTLTAKSIAGKPDASAQVTVRVVPPPVIDFFKQSPDGPVQLGSAVRLLWSSNGVHYQLDDSFGTHLELGSLTSALIRPLQTGVWTLTAWGPTVSSTAQLTLTVQGQQAAGLQYVDPPFGAESIRLERDPSSTAQSLVLLVKAAKALSIRALALDLPLDGATAGSRDGLGRVQLDGSAPALAGNWKTLSAGFDLDPSQLDPGGGGSAPPAALLRLARSGPLAGVLTLGIAQKPDALCRQNGLSCSGGKDGDAAIAAGAVLARIRLVPVPSGGAGPVILPAQLALPSSGYRALVRGTSSTDSTFAVGTLTATP